MTTAPYSKRFYDGLVQGSLDSARVYLAHLFAIWMPASVVDLGCGRGAWLAAAGERGVRRLVGIDGAWNSGETLQDAAIQFHAADLENEVTLAERFDLALSLEVAEHIRPESSDRFVASLARLSDALLFGAAFVGQPGTNHVNTRPHSFWARKFLDRGYRLFDLFRPEFWGDERVEPWYRQNTFLYVRADHPLYGALMARGHRPAQDARFVDAVHPWLFDLFLGEVVRLRKAAPAAAAPARQRAAAPAADPAAAPAAAPAPTPAPAPNLAQAPKPASAPPSPQAASPEPKPKPKLKLGLKPAPAPEPERATVPRQRVGRNDPCPCGSGKRFKHCHGRAA